MKEMYEKIKPIVIELFKQGYHIEGIIVDDDTKEFMIMSENPFQNLDDPRFVYDPIVRCKDCVRRGTDFCPMHINGTEADEELLKSLDNDYCSYGEMKGQER